MNKADVEKTGTSRNYELKTLNFTSDVLSKTSEPRLCLRHGGLVKLTIAMNRKTFFRLSNSTKQNFGKYPEIIVPLGDFNPVALSKQDNYGHCVMSWVDGTNEWLNVDFYEGNLYKFHLPTYIQHYNCILEYFRGEEADLSIMFRFNNFSIVCHSNR